MPLLELVALLLSVRYFFTIGNFPFRSMTFLLRLLAVLEKHFSNTALAGDIFFVFIELIDVLPFCIFHLGTAEFFSEFLIDPFLESDLVFFCVFVWFRVNDLGG